MTNTDRRASIRRAGRPTLAAVATGLAGLCLTTLAGCHSIKPEGAKTAGSVLSPVAQASAEGATAPKTEFHRDVGPEQEYNVHVELARVHETQGNNDAAIVEYQKAFEVSEKRGSGKTRSAQCALAQRRIGAALDRSGRFAQAETHYRQALKLAPDDARVWNDAGYSYYLQNRWADAERSFKTADKIQPDNAKTLTNMGLTLAAQGKTDEALRYLSRAGGPAIGHANLGFILAAMGKTDEAHTHYQEALALQPALVAARAALAQLEHPTAPSVAPGTTLAANTAVPRDDSVGRTSIPPPLVSVGNRPAASRAMKPVADLVPVSE